MVLGGTERVVATGRVVATAGTEVVGRPSTETVVGGSVVLEGTAVELVGGTDVVVVSAGPLAKKLLVMVAVQVVVLAPVVPEALHWSIVVGSPVS